MENFTFFILAKNTPDFSCQKISEAKTFKEKDVDYLSSIEEICLFCHFQEYVIIIILSLKKKNNCAYRVSYIVNGKSICHEQVLIIDHADVIAMQVCGAVNLIARNIFVAVHMVQIVHFVSYSFYF